MREGLQAWGRLKGFTTKVLHQGNFAPSRRPLAMSGYIFCWWRRYYWHLMAPCEGRGCCQPFYNSRDSSPTTKNYAAQNVNCGKVKTPCFRTTIEEISLRSQWIGRLFGSCTGLPKLEEHTFVVNPIGMCFWSFLVTLSSEGSYIESVPFWRTLQTFVMKQLLKVWISNIYYLKQIFEVGNLFLVF